jgi:2-methylisocitrate lyase-like PEP mutase family enzyme
MTEMLKKRLARGPSVVAPGAYDALSALLIEQAGFEAIYISGASSASTQTPASAMCSTSIAPSAY